MLKSLLALFVLVLLPIVAFAESPNVVLIFCDDMGYGDLHCFGSQNPTPNLDRMAEEGMKFVDFYAGQPICSASRAAIMTGCYPNRVSIFGALSPRSTIGINEHEFLMPMMFKQQGYTTAIVGKWHLGCQPQFSPIRHGFDEFFGLPYSHDMWPKHPGSGTYPDLPLMDGEKVVELDPDPGTLTTRYTQRAVHFIDTHKDKPFFLYLANSMPHVPLGVAPEHLGKSGRGLYGDVIYEIDWSVGQVMDALKRDGLDEKTLVIFTSDNGPWLLMGNHAGSAGIFREGKMTDFDGGLREPCIMRWPGKIPAATTCEKMACTMDLLPTFAALVGGQVPTDRTIDGRDIRKLMMNDPNGKGHDVYYFFWGRELQAVRSGQWKLHFAHKYIHVVVPGKDGQPGKTKELPLPESLFDMQSDPRELVNVIDQHPDIVEQLSKLAEVAREDLGDSLTKTAGKGVRPPGTVQKPGEQKASLDETFWQREISVFNPND